MKNNELSVNKASKLTASEKDRTDYVSPAVDIYETDNALTIVADLPGVNKEQLELATDRNILTIEGHAKTSADPNHLYREFGTAGYYRRFQLPENLDLDQTAAELKDGVLTLTLPKAAAAKPRRIEVTVH
ncbi:Hsp20/alpha crystallin family protein [Trichloromonas sp.]|uniref:Hsp20/alpha crystallin family protein n=1 Tax=Trichloromonas sp. TaxID=3069249 RepID=UPI003D817B74